MANAGLTVEQRLDRMEAIEAIRQLPYRYAFYIDSRNLDAFWEIWDHDVEPMGPPFLNYRTFADNPARFFETSVASVHFIGNHIVDRVDADSAHGYVYCNVHTDRHGLMIRQVLLYEDDYIRVDGEWRFHHRSHLLWWGEKVDPNPRGQEPMDWPHGDLKGAGSFGRGTLPDAFETYQAYWAAVRAEA